MCFGPHMRALRNQWLHCATCYISNLPKLTLCTAKEAALANALSQSSSSHLKGSAVQVHQHLSPLVPSFPLCRAHFLPRVAASERSG
jgi:hypothetical protein